jgi:hypothetical protein
VEVAAGGHAGEAADIMAVEGDRLLGETGETGRGNPCPSIRFERQAVQRVEENENRAHGS